MRCTSTIMLLKILYINRMIGITNTLWKHGKIIVLSLWRKHMPFINNERISDNKKYFGNINYMQQQCSTSIRSVTRQAHGTVMTCKYSARLNKQQTRFTTMFWRKFRHQMYGANAQQYWDGRPFGHSRHGRKLGAAMIPFWGSWVPI